MKEKKQFRSALFPILFLMTLAVCAPKAWGILRPAAPAEQTPPPPIQTAPEVPEVPELQDEPAEETLSIPMEKIEPAQPVERPEPEPPEEETPAEVVPPAPQSKEEFFSDMLFIGDSRTVGLSEYGGLPTASYFCNVGMSVYSVFSASCQVGDQYYDLETLLTEKTYGKIHLMLGINELGYDHTTTVQTYGQVVEKIRALQPEAVLYLGSNLHVSAEKSQWDDVYNNINLKKLNEAVAELADGVQTVYLDVNSQFDDGAGNLAAGYTGDGVHVYGSCYVQWGQWLYETICPAEMREIEEKISVKLDIPAPLVPYLKL